MLYFIWNPVQAGEVVFACACIRVNVLFLLQTRGFCCGLPACSGSGYSCRWDGSRGSIHCSHPKGWSAWIHAAGSCPASYACYNALSHPAYWWISVNNRYTEVVRRGEVVCRFWRKPAMSYFITHATAAEHCSKLQPGGWTVQNTSGRSSR